MKRKREWMLGYILTICGALALVHWGSRTVTVVSEHIPMSRQQCIVIDAGHGGIDGGATSCTGRLESSYNLEIALRLRDFLHFLGYNTKMVRVRDESIYREGKTIRQQKRSDLRERVKTVNETDNAILISIHQNQFSDPRYFGSQVFYADTPGSKELAECLQENLSAYLIPRSHREVKKSQDVYLMDHIQRTGILLECGFLSNPQEEARLADPAYQKKLCCIIGSALHDFTG